jgi:predicted metal-dependent HD superfamily phosphohydrolase
VFDQLVTAYCDSRRHYHSFDHVLDCLEVLDRFHHLARKPYEVEMALWFHDASVMANAGVGDDTAERVRRMILASCHRTPPETRDEALMLDIDLSVLGRDRAKFAEYEDQIRREFDWVADDAFQSGRVAVLTRFLDRPQIFLTSELRSQYEQRARENLESALRRYPTT